MTQRWAARFPRMSMDAALSLRTHAAIKACEEGDWIWITGSSEEIDILRTIPEIVRFVVGENDTITRENRRIPERNLPVGPWVDFSRMVELQPQPASLPASVDGSVAVRIVRGSSFSDETPAAMIVPIETWANYAATAPQVRLNSLRFAVCTDGRTLILGTPLPPLAGSYFVNHGGILVPCGFRIHPAIESQILRRVMKLSQNDFAVFDIGGTYELIAGENLVKATRSAARRSVGVA